MARLSLIVVLFLFGCLSPGSYPYAEVFVLDRNESDLIGIVTMIKRENPELCLPSYVELNDGRRNEDDYWYHIYFYYEDSNQIVKTWLRPAGTNKTSFAFVAINEGLELGQWKFINRDFSRSENKRQIERFEKEILLRVKEML